MGRHKGKPYSDVLTTKVLNEGTDDSQIDFFRKPHGHGWGASGMVAPITIKTSPENSGYVFENEAHKFRFVQTGMEDRTNTESVEPVGYGFWTKQKDRSVWTLPSGYGLFFQPDANLVIRDPTGKAMWALGIGRGKNMEGGGDYMFFMNRYNEPVVSTVLVESDPKRKEYVLHSEVHGAQRDGWLEFSDENGFAIMSGEGDVLYSYWKKPVVTENYVRFKNL